MPGRKLLPHDVPRWVDSQSEVWFLTIVCQPRGANQLARPELAPFLFDSITHRHGRGLWWAPVFLFMPDHCHALLRFPSEKTGPWKKTVRDWKHWVATQRGVRWQIDFFDHRLRRDESYVEKLAYIRDNPVRAHLVKHAGDWPYVWVPPDAVPFTTLRGTH